MVASVLALFYVHAVKRDRGRHLCGRDCGAATILWSGGLGWGVFVEVEALA